MNKQIFIETLKKEVTRIDNAKTAKRFEKVITGFTKETSPKAIINNKKITIFNSNDYLGLRHNSALKKAEAKTTEKFGTGPGAVRFISGTLSVHKDLEKALAKFHKRDDAMVFSSAFAVNSAVLFCLLKGQSKVSLIESNVLIISDELNHRSIIDGIRLAGLKPEQKQIFKHLNLNELERVLKENLGKFKRVIVVTDGVFSMLGELQNLKELKKITDRFDNQYPEGVLLVVDDSHGILAIGQTGRGVEEVYQTQADILISTLGKGLGCDGGYVVGKQVFIDYLRESAATYIYSNSISPGIAGAALKAIELIDKPLGKRLLKQSAVNIAMFKLGMKKIGAVFATESNHPIQPVLIGDPAKTKKLVQKMFDLGILVTSINYPVVPAGRDEIRVQISAVHTKADILKLVQTFKKCL